jgi:hypothetical protein
MQLIGEPPKEFYGEYTKKGKDWWRHVSISVDLRWSSVPAAIEALTEASVDLTDTSLDISEYNEYGDSMISTTVTGQRLATTEEVTWIKWQIKTDKEKRKKAEQDEIERFRMKHPDLLK